MKTKILLALILGIGSLAQGQITLTFEESGSDLIVSASGHYQVSATQSASVGAPVIQLFRIDSAQQQGVQSLEGTYGQLVGTYNTYNGGALPLSSEINIAQSTRSGDLFGFELKQVDDYVSIYGNSGFVAGNTVNGTATFTGLDITSAGLVDGTSGAFSIGNQDFSWYVGSAISAVPEPSTYAAIAFGVLGLGMILKRRLVKKANNHSE